MSADNGVYVGQFADGEFRVIEASAIGNLSFEPDVGRFNAREVMEYFRGAECFTNEDHAFAYAHKLFEKMTLCEYGVSKIKFDHSFAEYVDKASPKPGMAVYMVEIPEVHKAFVRVELPVGATRQEILEAAEEQFEDVGSDNLEYSHTLDDDEWTVRNAAGDYI